MIKEWHLCINSVFQEAHYELSKLSWHWFIINEMMYFMCDWIPNFSIPYKSETIKDSFCRFVHVPIINKAEKSRIIEEEISIDYPYGFYDSYTDDDIDHKIELTENDFYCIKEGKKKNYELSNRVKIGDFIQFCWKDKQFKAVLDLNRNLKILKEN